MKYPQRWHTSLQPRSNIRALQLGQMSWMFSSGCSGNLGSSGSGWDILFYSRAADPFSARHFAGRNDAYHHS
jgi:hypothetical protein